MPPLTIIGLILTLVGAALCAVLVLRRRRGTASRPILVAGVLLVVAAGLAGLAASALRLPAAARPTELLVEVTASQCTWRFDYLQSGASSQELVLPVGRPVLFKITSLNTTRAFSVPGLSLSREAKPGRWTQVRITPVEIDSYQLGEDACASAVRIVEPMAFESWLADQPSGGRPTPVLSAVEKGRQLAETNGCLGCHSVDGSRLAGPTWLHQYGTQRALADGSTVLADDEYVRTAILEPRAQIAAGFPDIMPPAYTMLDDAEVQAIVDYIASLK